MRVKFLILLLIVLGIVTSIPRVEKATDLHIQCIESMIPSSIVESVPLSIDGNNDPQWSNFSGEGTIDNPYIIENLFFNLNDTTTEDFEACSGNAIQILNTNAHVSIQNCVFQGRVEWVVDDPPWMLLRGIGINLRNVRNVELFNNSFVLINTCIQLDDISNCFVKANTFNGNPLGRPSDFISTGINIGESSNFVVSDNVFENCSTAIVMHGSSNSLIENNSITICDSGIMSLLSVYNTISRNNCSLNFYGGITLDDSDNMTIIENMCNNNGYWGIRIDWWSIGNIVTNNTCSLNGDYNMVYELTTEVMLASDVVAHGILMEEGSTENDVVWNTLIDNEMNVQNDVDGNNYDYNYYSDYNGTDIDGNGIGDTPYDIDGAAPTQDLHPRGPLTVVTTTEPTSTTTDNPRAGTILIVGGLTGIVILVLILYVKRPQS